MFPIEQGAAEIISYLALQDEDVEIDMDDTDETLLDFAGTDGRPLRARLPKVTVKRR